METVAWIGFSQSLFAGILIASKRKKELHDKLLAVWLLICAIEFLSLSFSLNSDKFFLTSPFLIFNPILYFYIKSLINKDLRIKWLDFLHILPAIFFLAISYLLKIEISLNTFFDKQPYLWYSFLFAIVILISFIVYSILSIIEVHKYRINLKNLVSTIDAQKNLKWLLFVLIYYILYFAIVVTLGAINVFANIITYTIIVSYCNLLFMVYVFGFYGLQQKAVNIYKQNDLVTGKYKKSKLPDATKQKIKTSIITLFETNKIFLDSELTIQMVSEKINIQRHTLTEVLNMELGKNFYQFVNEYRVNAVKSMLSDKKNDLLSIEAIGYDCGFSSKSTFFAVFKSFTGITPLQFKNSR